VEGLDLSLPPNFLVIIHFFSFVAGLENTFQNPHLDRHLNLCRHWLPSPTCDPCSEQGSLVSLHFNKVTKTLQEVLQRYPKTAMPVQADVAKEADVARAMAECVRRHGPIHVLVVNHGIWPAEDVLVKDLSLERWNHTIAVNLTGSFLLIREFLRQVERHRLNDNVAIVMVGSTAGKFGEAFHAGMCRFPRYASSTFHPHRVRAFVCVLCRLRGDQVGHDAWTFAQPEKRDHQDGAEG